MVRVLRCDGAWRARSTRLRWAAAEQCHCAIVPVPEPVCWRRGAEGLAGKRGAPAMMCP